MKKKTIFIIMSVLVLVGCSREGHPGEVENKTVDAVETMVENVGAVDPSAEERPKPTSVGMYPPTEAPTTQSSENDNFIYKKDEKGRVILVEDTSVSMVGDGEKIESEGFVNQLMERAKTTAMRYIPFTEEVLVENQKAQGVFSIMVYERTKEGVMTGNCAYITYGGKGRFMRAMFTYQDDELTETEFIDEKEVYEKAVQGIVDKYGEEREVDLPSFEEAHELDLQYFEGRYRYVLKITDNKNSMGDAVDPAKDHHYSYTVGVDAVTGEVLFVASCL